MLRRAAWCRIRWRGRSSPASARARSRSSTASSDVCWRVADMPASVERDIDTRTMMMGTAIYQAFEMMLTEADGADPHHRADLDRRRVHRSRGRREAAAHARCTASRSTWCCSRWRSRSSPRRWSISRCITCSCGRCGGSPTISSPSMPILKALRASSRRRIAATRSARRSANSPTCSAISCRCCIRRAGSQRSASPSRRSTTTCATCWRRRS